MGGGAGLCEFETGFRFIVVAAVIANCCCTGYSYVRSCTKIICVSKPMLHMACTYKQMIFRDT